MATTIADSGEWSDIATVLNTNFSNLESSVGDKADSSSLATVATTGDYDDLTNKPVLGTAAAQNTTAFATATQGGKADTAVQPGDLGDLAVEDEVGIADLSATGTPSSSTFLRGDNVWAVPPGGGGAAWGSISGTLADQTDLQAALDAKAGTGDVFSGDYDDLTNKPTLFSGSYNDLSDTPSFATVATSGDYSDLINTPTPFSGSYDDLTDKPTLGTAAASDTGDFATAAQGTKADSALQSADIGDLATLDEVSISDINATGTPDGTKFLRGDGVWAVPATSSVSYLSSVRQTVMTGPIDSDGRAGFLIDGGGLSVDSENLDTTSLFLSFGDGIDLKGEKNIVVELDSNISFSSLTDDDTSYLYIDYDTGTETATAGSTTLAPEYSYAKPTSPSTGQYWYPIDHRSRGEVWDGSVWQSVLRLFIGQATTSGGSVVDVVSYAYQGSSYSDLGSSFSGDGSLVFDTRLGVKKPELIVCRVMIERFAGAWVDISSSNSQSGGANRHAIEINPSTDVVRLNAEETDITLLSTTGAATNTNWSGKQIIGLARRGF